MNIQGLCKQISISSSRIPSVNIFGDHLKTYSKLSRFYNFPSFLIFVINNDGEDYFPIRKCQYFSIWKCFLIKKDSFPNREILFLQKNLS